MSASINQNSNSSQKRIKKLPPLLVNQLAAGEVVTRPASVVKELIENALDAGARHIDVRITQGGMGSIEVRDDGEGIHPDDMVMAVTRFATSKIADVAHLQGIATLGFRGEALAATAAVSRLTLTSCADQSGIGRELNVAGILEDTPELVPVVHPQGTTVIVRDLYFNVPARRGNLKSISTEYAHIEMVVKQLALVASNVSFSLWHNDKRRFHLEAIDIDYQDMSVNPLAGQVSGQNTTDHHSTVSNNNHYHDSNNNRLCHPDVITDTNNDSSSSDDNSADKHSDGYSVGHKDSPNKDILSTSNTHQSALMQAVLARLMAVLPATHDQAEVLHSDNLEPIALNLEGLLKQQATWPQPNNDSSSIGSRDNVNNTNSTRNDGFIGITGLLIPSAKSLTNAAYKLIYINGRLVKDRRIAQCLRECTNSVEGLQSLGYVLFFNVPTAWLNINVHPSKQCVKVQNLANIVAHLQVGVSAGLQRWKNRQHELAQQQLRKQQEQINQHSNLSDNTHLDDAQHAQPYSQPQQTPNKLSAVTQSNRDYRRNYQTDIEYSRSNASAMVGSVTGSFDSSKDIDTFKSVDALSVSEPLQSYQAHNNNPQLSAHALHQQTQNKQSLDEQTLAAEVQCLFVGPLDSNLEMTDCADDSSKDVITEPYVLLLIKEVLYVYSEQGVLSALDNSQLLGSLNTKHFNLSNTDLSESDLNQTDLSSTEHTSAAIQSYAHYHQADTSAKQQLINKWLQQIITTNQTKDSQLNQLTNNALGKLSLAQLMSQMLS
ncbi:DNA mismatch repair endonuclease MutL [Psychrobacter sp. FDAARGOS_221]|uniref:DNA mismatch repair endonuclease MutL n=1 Tax=Psychrobacter sp. FDAARGOS_221 TaxID=1975705 RepID=UPI000BB56B15|nr:DNA mismatch repair endonuclease MutL [Psychrobacter sp. FDAARGOS_221]PNK61586.1 ATPase [Psychrobacter sp. FDAARGOS_221]